MSFQHSAEKRRSRSYPGLVPRLLVEAFHHIEGPADVGLIGSLDLLGSELQQRLLLREARRVQHQGVDEDAVALKPGPQGLHSGMIGLVACLSDDSCRGAGLLGLGFELAGPSVQNILAAPDDDDGGGTG